MNRAPPPSSAVLINYGVISTTQRNIKLYVNATDTPLNGLAGQASGALASPWTELNEISGDVHMRFRNAGDTDWTVEAHFRDAALNESAVVFDTISLLWPETLYMPIIMRLAP